MRSINMPDSLDKVIFVGVKKPDEETQEGKIALRRLMDIAEVSLKDIVFEEAGTSNVDIIQNNFNKDPSSKKTGGYRIGNAVCIGTSDLDNTYQLKLNALKKLSIIVRLGYDNVDLASMSEGQILKWFQSGKLVSREETTDSRTTEDPGNVDDILDSLLDLDEEKPTDSQSEQQNDTREGINTSSKVEPTEVHTPDAPDLQEQSGNIISASQSDSILNDDDDDDIDDILDIFNGIDDDFSDTDIEQPISQSDNHPVLQTVIQDEPQANEQSENTVSDNGSSTYNNSDDFIDQIKSNYSPSDNLQESSVSVKDSVDNHFSAVSTAAHVQDDSQDFMDEINKIKNSTSTHSSPFEESQSNQEESTVGSSSSSSGTAIGDDDLDFLSDIENNMNHSDVHNNSDSSRAYTEEQHSQHTVQPSDVPVEPQGEFKTSSDLSLEERSEKEREIQRRKAELRRAMQSNSVMNDSIDRSKANDIRDAAQELNNSASERLESEYNTDGHRKTYKEYLDDNQQQEQNLVESSHKMFGTEFSHAHKAKISGGKIFLVSAGKGGVGKSLVASGIASALALSKAKDIESKTGRKNNETWLIESDYTAPQMSVAYKTRDKHIGHLADYLASERKNSARDDSSIIKNIIEENVHIDEETGLRVIACPSIIDSDVKLSMIPLAILLVIKHANNRGDDVIIDHGNLTRAEYSEFDKVLSTEIANYVILVTTASSSTTAWSVAKMLTTKTDGSVSKILNHHQVSLVLNKATNEQYEFLRRDLAPYDIGMIIPPINALREENTRDGDVSLGNMPLNVKKAIINRCGLMLVNKLGYSQYSKYFSTKRVPGATPKTGRKKTSFIQRLVDRFVG